MNKNIGFTTVGQDTVVKLDAFPFTRYGTIAGHVTKIAADAILEPDAARREGDPRGTTAGDNVRRRRNNADLSLSRYHQA
ncbi:hypothetical protein HFO63_05860 [Rhizobium laguerreae]|uniref:hypothetical protein n=1 Tax=Rhizobium laguerreae TaxID=1076926 RepID=UPI001C908793|nr:hypothetical protein [Rhizobium laguerreae]MBY3083343.1 hypothetical protein [Rhizobium laguerreae]MBY3145124.1 hypothetical protein [Rhizobium laguerreae]